MTFLEFERRSQQVLQSLRPRLEHIGRVLYVLRAQLIVSVLAFVALSGVGEIHQTYRSLVLDLRYGTGGFLGAILGVVALSVTLWYSSLLVLVFMPDWPRAPSFRSLRAWSRELAARDFRSGGDSPEPWSTAAIVATVSVLPLLGLALGLWLAIPNTPQHPELRFRAQDLLTPDLPRSPNRTELSPGVTPANRT